ncbi:MAG: helix-turn-helix transcriptional regulator [Clostridia bacterium]|nr:helix-turn-helix transcriptional regulator [Clostridia bacterium]
MENKDIVKNAVQYINSSVNNKTTIEEVARNAGFSIDYFNRVFRAHTGFNVMEYARFRRINKAANMLRSAPEKDILSIALDCGYESHEGFARAFKEHYGKTPSEYREAMRGKPFVFADHELNATAASEFRHALPDFYEMDAGEVIAELLEKDALRYGYTAVTIAFNGSKVLSDGGCFVTVDNFYEKPHLTLILDDSSVLPEYVEKFKALTPSNIDVIFGADVSPDEVKNKLCGISLKGISERPESMYFGKPFTFPEEAKKYNIRFLEEADLPETDDFIAASSNEIFRKTGGCGIKKTLGRPLAERPLLCPSGIFDATGKLLAIAYDGLQSTHGFMLNNCIHTPHRDETPDEVIKFLYMFATNAVIEKGYIPFEDSQFGEYAQTHGNFTAFDLGFEKVNTVFSIKL